MTPDIHPLAALSSWARDRYGGSWPLRAEALKFIRSYQETPTEPKPFVGRAALMGELDEWLKQSGSRLLLLSGAAGRGKSALLLHFLDRLILSEGAPTVLYLPISIRFNTANETAGIQLLFAALCDVFPGLKAQLPQQAEAHDYLQAIHSGWEQMAQRPTQAFLLVVDGLDEAVNQWFLERHLLPQPLPRNLHVLLAARHPPGHASGEAWLADLGVDGTSAGVREIGCLAPEAMTEAVLKLRPPLDRLAQAQAFTEHLHRLTDGGDPLLLTLWLGEIWRHREALPDLDPAALAQLSPGFGELYNLWLKEQQSLWAAAGLDIRPQDLREVMHVLATAQGRLRLADLLAVLGSLSPGRWEPRELDTVLATAQRLIVGDETGYVLVHPRLAQHFQAQLTADPPRCEAVRAAFREWGADTVRRLNSGELQPADCPAYLLTHYVAVHLEAPGEPRPQALEDSLLPLLRPGWAHAWHAREGAWHGYLNDLETLARRLHDFNQGRLQAGDPPRLAVETRCALLAATIRSLIGNLPGELLAHLARAGVWSLARATGVARQHEPLERARALTTLATLAADQGQPAEATALRLEALEAAAAIEEPADRARAACAVAAHLTGEARHTALRQGLEALWAVADDEDRAEPLSELAPLLQADSALLREALERARTIEDPAARIGALRVLAAQCPRDIRHTVLQEALAVAAAIRPGHSQRAHALTTLASDFQGEARRTILEMLQRVEEPATLLGLHQILEAASAGAGDDLLPQAIQIASAFENPSDRALCLGAVATHLTEDAQRTLLEQSLQAAAQIETPAGRAQTLCLLLQAMPTQRQARSLLLEGVLQAALGLADERERAPVLRTIASRLQDGEPLMQALLEAAAALHDADVRSDLLYVASLNLKGQARQRILRQALAARTPEHAHWRAAALCELARPLQGDARRAVLEEALAQAGSAAETFYGVPPLARVAELLQGERALLQRTLTMAAGLRYQASRCKVVLAAAPWLATDPDLWQQALAVTATVGDASERAAALHAAADAVQGERRHAVLQRALAVAAALPDPKDRAKALTALASSLPEDSRRGVLEQALEAALAIEDEQDRASAVSAVAAHPGADRDLLQQVLAAASRLRDEADRASAVGAVADALAADTALLQQALEAAAMIEDGSRRVHLLTTVAARLPEDARAAVLQQALAGAQRIAAEGQDRARALCEVATQLQGEARPRVVAQALEAAARVPDDWSRAHALCDVAPLLTASSALLRQGLELAGAIEFEIPRASALSAVAAQLQGDSALWEQALERASQIEGELARSRALTAMIAQLPDRSPLLPQALTAIRGIKSPRERAGPLCAVAVRLQGEAQRTVLEEALAAAAAIDNGSARAEALRGLAEPLLGEVRRAALRQALEEAGGIEDETQRADALYSLSEQLPQDPELNALYLKQLLTLSPVVRIAVGGPLLKRACWLLTYDLWSQWLTQARLTRPLLLFGIGALVGCAGALTGRPEEAAEIADAICDVCEWFP